MFVRLVLVCLVTLAGVTLLATHHQTEERADFRYVNASGIHTLDPARMSWTQDLRVALNLWEGLTTWDPQTMAPIEGAAHFPPEFSDDRLTYTFRLREDSRWSNGDRVTAGDFIRGWRRGLEPGTATDYAFLFTSNIAGAKDYVDWRNAAIAGFTAMEQATGEGRRAHLEALRAHAREMDERFSRIGLVAGDDQTLVVRLHRPCPYFLDLTAFATFLPCHESVEVLRERFADTRLTAQGLVAYDPQWTKPDYRRNGYPGLITNGAYRLEDWAFKRRARMTVNPYFRDAERIRCRTIDMLEYSDTNSALLAYEAGEVDFLTDLNVPYDHEIARLARSGERPDFHACTLLATYFLNFNCVSQTVAGRKNPFVDARVRKAFTLALDREQLIQKVRHRGDRTARSFVPPSSLPGYEPPRGLPRDVEGARRLLTEAGYPGGAGMDPVEVLCVANDERMVQALARMWHDTLGVEVELRSQESKTFAEEKANHRFMIARGNWYADYNDPTTFLDCLLTGNGNNDSGYSSAKYDGLMRTANEAANAADRLALLGEAEAVAIEEDCPVLPLLHYSETIAIKPYVRGLFPNARLWFPFRYVTIER